MNNKKIIKDILIEELSKCNNFNYYIYNKSLTLKVNTKKLYQILVDHSHYFEGGVGSEWRLDCYKNKYFYISYYDIWSKFEKETKLQCSEIKSIVKDVFEEGFKLKGITPEIRIINADLTLEEGFKLKGITTQGIMSLK